MTSLQSNNGDRTKPTTELLGDTISHARNFSFFYPLRWPIYVFNSVVNTKFPAIHIYIYIYIYYERKKRRNYISRQACFVNRFTLQGFNIIIFYYYIFIFIFIYFIFIYIYIYIYIFMYLYIFLLYYYYIFLLFIYIYTTLFYTSSSCTHGIMAIAKAMKALKLHNPMI